VKCLATDRCIAARGNNRFRGAAKGTRRTALLAIQSVTGDDTVHGADGRTLAGGMLPIISENGLTSLLSARRTYVAMRLPVAGHGNGVPVSVPRSLATAERSPVWSTGVQLDDSVTSGRLEKMVAAPGLRRRLAAGIPRRAEAWRRRMACSGRVLLRDIWQILLVAK